MSLRKIRVRPCHPHKGLLALCALLGIVCGLVLNLVLLNFAVLVIIVMLPVLVVLLVGGFVLPLYLLAHSLTGLCQHKKWIFLAGLLFGSFYASTAIVAFLFSQLWVVTGPLTTILWAVAIAVCVGLGTGLFNLFARQVCVIASFVLLEQDGTLCTECGYPARMSKSLACPECGASTETPTRRHGILGRAARWLEDYVRAAVVVMAIISVTGVGSLVWHHWPYWVFVRTFSNGDNVFEVPVFSPSTTSASWPPGPQDPQVPQGIETYMQAQQDTSKAIVMLLYRPSYTAAPLLQLRLGGRESRAWSSSVFARDGQPRIVCNLDKAQTRYVIEHGIPPSLANALVAKANGMSWQPPVPGVSAIASTSVTVAANEHFP